MTDDDLTRLRDEVAEALEREYGCKPGMIHEGYGAECASAAHAPALYRTFGCDHVAHVADALLPLLAREITEARAEALREAADGLALRRLGMAFDDPWRKGWNRALEVARDDLATLAEPTGPEGER